MNKLPAFAFFVAVLFAAACGGSCPDDFLRSCARKGCAEKVKAALAKDASLASKPGAGARFPLQVAGDAAIAEALLAAGAQMTDGNPLGSALEDDRGDVVKLLLSRGAAIHDVQQTANGMARAGKPSSLEALLDSGATVNGAMLFDAVINDHRRTAEFLLKRGLDPNMKADAGLSLYTIGGANPGAKDVSGKSLLELAPSEAMRGILKKGGAN